MALADIFASQELAFLGSEVLKGNLARELLDWSSS